jgi:hypothetical protein
MDWELNVMKKMRVLLLNLLLLLPLSLSADFIEDIGKKGNITWDNLILLYKRFGWRELAPPKSIADKFSQYKDKVMRFPLVDFSDVINDSKGNQYYYYGRKEEAEIVLFTYHDGLTSKLGSLNAALGNLGSQYEVMGSIIDVQHDWEDWETVIFVKPGVVRIKNRVCVVVEGNTVIMVGQSILDVSVEGLDASGEGLDVSGEELDASGERLDVSVKGLDASGEELALAWTYNIPEDIEVVPAGLDPESVAKWFLFFGSITKNLEVWTQLCSVQENVVTGAHVLRPKGRTWWHTLSSGEQEYRFVGEDLLNGTDTERVFLYYIRENGVDVGEPLSLTVVLEQAGQWRVSLF